MDSEESLNIVAATAPDSGNLAQTNNIIEDEVIIRTVKLNKYFGDKHVLKDIDFEVRKKEVVAVIGPSGSGKSTLIRCLNGLEKATSGEIYIHGHKLDPRFSIKQLSPIRSELGMVFQNFNAGRSSVSLLHGPWLCSPRPCSSMSRPQHSIPNWSVKSSKS